MNLIPIMRQKKGVTCVTLGLIAVIFLLPTSSAYAGWFDVPAAAVQTIITVFLSNIFYVMGKLVAILAEVLNYAIYIRAGGDIPIVAATWKILRDFSNMMFVVILIYIAFATIFNLGNYVFQKMILRFVIVAVLINFSLVIGGLVVDASQVLSNIFLGSIGNLGDRLGAYLTPAALLPSTVGGAADLAGASIVSLLFSIILFGILLFSMAVAATFAIIRVPYIWALLIVSPFAWMSYTLPNAQSWWKKWWSLFIGWNLFLPVYLFFMYLGLLFLSKRDEVMVAIASNSSEPLLGLGNSVTFNLLFFYIFTAMVLLGGTWAATSTTKLLGGAGFEKGLGWARTFVKRTPWLGSRVGSLDSHEYATKKRFEQFQKGGFKNQYLNKVYGGQEGLERARSNVASRAPYNLQKQFTGEAKKRFDEFTEEYDTGKLNVETLRTRAATTKATTAEGYAYRKLAVQKGAVTDDTFKQTLRDLHNNPFAIQDIVKTAKDAKFAGIKDLKGIALDPTLGGSNFIPAKREILLHMAGDAKQASKFGSLEDIDKAVEILGKGSPEATKFLDDLAKVRPDLVFKYRAQNDLFSQPPLDATGKKSTMPTLYGTVRKALNTSPKDLASIPEDLWKSGEFKQALREKLYDQNTSQKNRNSLRSNIEKVLNEQGEEEKLKILNEVAPRTDFSDRQGGGNTNAQGQPRAQGQTGGRGQGTGGRNPIGFAPPTNRTGGQTVSYDIPEGINQSNVIDLRAAIQHDEDSENQ